MDAVGLELSNKLQQKRVAKECSEWIKNKVEIKTIKQSNLLHGKMYHIATGGVLDAILGSSNFTVRGLGLGSGNNNIELEPYRGWKSRSSGTKALVRRTLE